MKIRNVSFQIKKEGGNIYAFHAQIKTSEQLQTAREFAEDLGMLVYNEAPHFYAIMTNDTYTYILPLKIDKYKN